MTATMAGSRPALSRAAIVAAARRIADSEGLGALTLRRVAAEFGTGQASLYRHIASRAELVGLLADDLIAGYPVIAAAGGDDRPAAMVIGQWQAIHDHLAAHPWAARLIAEGAYLGRGAGHVAAAVTAQLERAGLGPADAARAYRALWHLLLGHLLSTHPFGHPDSGAQHAPQRAGSTDADRAGFSWALRRLIVGAISEQAADEGAGNDPDIDHRS